MSFENLKNNLILQEKKLESKLSEIFKLTKKKYIKELCDGFDKLLEFNINEKNQIELKYREEYKEKWNDIELMMYLELDNILKLDNTMKLSKLKISKYDKEIWDKMKEYKILSQEYIKNENIYINKLQNQNLYELFLRWEVININKENISENQTSLIKKQKEYFWILWDLEISQYGNKYIICIPNLYILWNHIVLQWTHIWNTIIQYYWKLYEYILKWCVIIKKEDWLEIHYLKWKNGIYISNSIMNDNIYNQ